MERPSERSEKKEHLGPGVPASVMSEFSFVFLCNSNTDSCGIELSHKIWYLQLPSWN